MKLVTPAMVESNTVDAPQQNNLDLLPAVIPPKAAEDLLEPTDKFDWSDPEVVVLREQPETACYFNTANDLVIRQRRYPDDDSIIIIAANNIDTFLDKITDVCGVPSFGGPPK